MQVSIKSNCWDGSRSKLLTEDVSELVKAEVVPQLERPRVRFDPKLKALLSFAVPLTVLAGLSPSTFAASVPQAAVPAMAATTQTTILHAFDPLIHLIQSLSYPIAGIMIAGGCLMIMVQQREQGFKMLQNAAIGYILVQLSPMLLQLLVGIGGSV